MSTTRLFYARAVLYQVGVHESPQAEQCLVAVMVGEDSTALWNPMDTTRVETGGWPYNTFGPEGEFHVWNYPTAAVGVAATVTTLEQKNMGPWFTALRDSKLTALQMAEAFSKVPWGGVGDVLPLEIIQEYLDNKRSYVADRRNLVHGNGPWTYQSNGAPHG